MARKIKPPDPGFTNIQYLDPAWCHLWRIVLNMSNGTNLQPCKWMICHQLIQLGVDTDILGLLIVDPNFCWLDILGKNTRENLTSGQITIIPKPELKALLGDSLTKPPFRVTSAEVAILCPVTCPLKRDNVKKGKYALFCKVGMFSLFGE